MKRSVLFGLLMLACSTPRVPPATATKTHDPSAEAQAMVGQMLAGLLTGFTGSIEDPELERYVSDVGRRVARASGAGNVDFQFHVIDDSEPSASSMVGGQVLISRGLLVHLGSEAELAAVLGHEIGHVVAGHTERSFLRLAQPDEDRAWDQELERDEERQADALAVRILEPCRLSPRRHARHAAGAVSRRRRRAELQRHPQSPRPSHAPGSRCPGGRGRASRRGVGPASLSLAHRRHCGGSRVRYLCVSGTRPVASPRGLGVQPPRRLGVDGGKRSIAAANADKSQAMVAMRVLGRSSDFYRRAVAHTLRQQPFSVTRVLGHRATTGLLPDKSGAPSKATLIDLGASSWMFASTQADGGSEHETLMQGLRRWDPKRDRVPARPRLALMRVTAPTTLAKLAARCGPDLAQLERLNGISPDTRISKGRTLKCVAFSRRSRR